jgi:site-specific DNA-methyltransferase (adenine-specific)
MVFGIGRIVWDKENDGSNFSDCEIAYQSLNNVTRKFKFRWNGMLQENMKEKEFRIHSTQKPVALYKWLLSNYAKPNNLILDTHVGSASSLIAFEDMGFKYVACELNKDYYNISMDRLTKHLSQGKLFQVNHKQVEVSKELRLINE